MGWQPLPEDVPLDHETLPPPDRMAAPATDAPAPSGSAAPTDTSAPAGFVPLPADAPLDQGPDGQAAPDGSGFTDEQKRQILDYIPKAKDAADLERFSLEISGGKARIGNAQSVLDKLKNGAAPDAFAWTPPTVRKDMAQPADHQQTIRDAIGDGILNAIDGMAPGVGTFLRLHRDGGKAFTEHAANAVAFDYGPEVGGAIQTILHGGDLSNNVAHERAIMEGDSADHGVAAAAGELAGIVPTALAGGAAADALNLGKIGRTAQMIGEGAAYGSGAAGPGERVPGAIVGAVAAPLTAAAVRGAAAVPGLLKTGTQTVLEGSPGLARRIIARAIKDDANTPETVANDIAAAHGNDVPMALADTGENVRGLLAAASRSSGMARTVARDALEERQQGLADRVTSAIQRDLGPVANPHELADSLMTRARNDAAPIYERFYSQEPIASPAIDAMVNRPSMQKALKNAYRIAKEEGRDPEALGFRLADDGEVAVEPAPPAPPAPAPRTPDSSLNRTASWVIRNKDTGKVVMETFDRGMVDRLNTAKYEAVPIGEYLGSINGRSASSATADSAATADRTHLSALYRRLDDEQNRLSAARTEAERAHRQVFVDQIKREIEGEKKFLGIADTPESALSDDELLHELNGGSSSAPPKTKPSREPVKTYTPQTLDYIKRGMDDVVEGYKDPTTGRYNFDTEGRAVNNTLRSYLKVVDDLFPDYAQARKAYGGPVSGISAMNLGRKALNMSADDLEARMRDMTPFEKEMFALGTRRAMAETVAAKGDTADVVNALVGTGKKRAMLARLFGDRKSFQRFVDTLGQEREGWRTFKQGLLGSPTAANIQDDAALQTSAIAADIMLSGGVPVATATSKAIKFLGVKVGKKAQEDIAALLSNTDPATIRELAAELRAKAAKRGVNVPRVRLVSHGAGTGTAVLIPRSQAQ